MKLVLVALLVSLVGCAAPEPRTITVVQRVEVPIPVRCEFPRIEPPTLYFNQVTKQTSPYKAVQLLAAENKSLDIYSQQLKAALIGCSKDPINAIK